MPNPALHITSIRMIALIEEMIIKDIAKNQGDALEQIGLNPANFRKIRSGANKFTVDQIDSACRITGASADYIFGYTNHMMRKEPRTPVEMIKAALQMLEGKKIINASLVTSIIL